MEYLADPKPTRISRFLTLVLRHKPDTVGIRLDQNGWADVAELIAGVNRTGKKLDIELLEKVVAEDNKKRYTFNEDHTKIRANQGHSINVDVELKEAKPPMPLYHGTAFRFLNSIKEQGLKKRSRLYVHLSTDVTTAVSVGRRHGGVVVLQIDTSAMIADGFKFYLSENNVWLCESVPSRYITELKGLSF